MTTARQRSPAPIRDAALLALHLFSGIPPHLVRELRWEDWRLTTLKDGIAWVELGPVRFVVGADAVHAMQTHWLAEGQPSVGPVFRAIVRPRDKLKPRAIHNHMSAFAKQAGVPNFDLRRLRVAFAWSLKAKGWDDLALRDAFGYETLQSLRKALRPYEAESALRRAQELLTLTPPHCTIPIALDALPTSHDSRLIEAFGV